MIVIYECKNCGWKGDIGEVKTVHTHKFMGIDETEMAEEDNEIIEVCPICEPYQIVYRNKY